jgi:hypothetical protein
VLEDWSLLCDERVSADFEETVPVEAVVGTVELSDKV